VFHLFKILIECKYIGFDIIFKELFPAIRYNLFVFEEKTKRISTTIGAKPINGWVILDFFLATDFQRFLISPKKSF